MRGKKIGKGVRLLVCLLSLHFVAGHLFAQATQPATDTTEVSSTSSSSYDILTTKRLTGDWGGARTELEDLGFKVDLSFQHQWQQNFKGGLDTHHAYRDTGTFDLVFKFDFEKMGLIDNAGFYFKAKGSYDDGISSGKVGALSKVNSDASGDHPIFVKKWWYWQKFMDDKVEIRLGNIEINKDLFDVSLYANHEDKDFLNQSTIRNTTVPHRTGIGAYLNVEPMDDFYVRVAAVDRQSRARRTGFDTAFHDEAWYVAYGELGWTPEFESDKGPMPGSYRLGMWLEGGEDKVFGRETKRKYDDIGFYVGADQMVWKENADEKDKQGLGLFARYGWADQDVNRVRGYWELGSSYRGLIPTRDDDVFGFAVSQSILSKVYRQKVRSDADRETVYEWYYQLQLTPWMTLSPDFQVITNPGGGKENPNSIFGGIRLRVIF